MKDPIDTFTPSEESIRSRAAFIAAIRDSLENGQAFAAGKLGNSEQVWVASRFLLKQAQGDASQTKAIKAASRFHATMQYGVFPATDDYLLAEVVKFAAALN